MYVTRLPSLRNINRVVDELGNGKKSEWDPSQAPTISDLTQSKRESSITRCCTNSLNDPMTHSHLFPSLPLRSRNEPGSNKTGFAVGQHHGHLLFIGQSD